MNINVSITAEGINGVLETAKPFLLGYAVAYCFMSLLAFSFIAYVFYNMFIKKGGF